MTSEAYSSAGRAAGRYARVLLGRTAGTSLGLGLAGAVGSTVLYEKALTPLGSHDKLKGFHESTLNVYITAALTVAAAEKNAKAEQAEEALQPAPAENVHVNLPPSMQEKHGPSLHFAMDPLTQTVADLKAQIEVATGVPPSQQLVLLGSASGAVRPQLQSQSAAAC